MPHSIKVGIVGVNQYIERMLQEIADRNIIPESNIFVYDKTSDIAHRFSTRNFILCDDVFSVILKSEIIFITVKKNAFGSTLVPIRSMTGRKVLVSTVEGVDCRYLTDRVVNGTYGVYVRTRETQNGNTVISIEYSNGFPSYLKEVITDIFSAMGTIE